MSTTPFEELKRLAADSGVEKALDFLEHHFRRDKAYFKLFEVLKMRCRNRLGIPLIYTQQPDNLDPKQQIELEDGLLEACREVGTLLVKNGQLQEGWMYLQPVGDRELSDKLIRSVKPDEENTDSIIEIAVNQGAAPGYGYQLLLEHYGTCNGITTFDTQAARFDKSVQKQMAETLLNHIYEELMTNVRYAVEQTNNKVEDTATLAEILASYPTLTDNGAHHIDTTHLASVMRIARVVDSNSDLQKAAELAEYGSRLDEDFQYPGQAPFEDTYVDHRFFYNALLGKEVEQGIQHFKQKAASLKVDEFGPVADETLVEFLVRLGRNDEAITVATERLLGQHEPLGIAPSPFEIATTGEQMERLAKFYQSQDDLLGFAVTMLKQQTEVERAS